MKFNTVFDKIPNDPILHIEESKQSVMDDVLEYFLYENLAIYIMKQGIKGNFKAIAPLVNNGKNPASWAIRIYNINNEWTLHFAPHPNITIDINLREEVEALLGREVLGHNHVVMFITTRKDELEEVINFLIKGYSTKKLDGVEGQHIDSNYTIESSNKKYKLPAKYATIIESFDEETYDKYLIIIKKLLSNDSIDKKEKDEIIRIGKRFLKSKYLNTRESKFLNTCIEKHLDTHSKIKIALQYILTKNN